MRKIDKLKMGTRLILSLSSVVVLAIAAVVLFIALRVGGLVRQDALRLAAETAGRYGNTVKAQLEEALDEARSLGKIFEAASALDNVDLSRRQSNALLKYFIEHSPAFLGVYVAFEPDAFDGKDVNFIDEWGHDGSGRFIPYWTRDGQGKVSLEALVDYDKEGAGDYYLLPKRVKHEVVLDPYLYTVQGREVLLTSLVVPILDGQGRFIGIAGIDLLLVELQKMVSAVTLFDSGTLTLYSANGTVCGSRDPAALGRNVAELVDGPLLCRTDRPACGRRGGGVHARTVARLRSAGLLHRGSPRHRRHGQPLAGGGRHSHLGGAGARPGGRDHGRGRRPARRGLPGRRGDAAVPIHHRSAAEGGAVRPGRGRGGPHRRHRHRRPGG